MSGTRGVGNSKALPGRGSHFVKSVTPGGHHPSSRWSAASPETPHKASNASDGSARGPGRGRESIVGCVREGKRRRGVDVLGEVRRDERREGNRRPGGEARRDERGKRPGGEERRGGKRKEDRRDDAPPWSRPFELFTAQQTKSGKNRTCRKNSRASLGEARNDFRFHFHFFFYSHFFSTLIFFVKS